MRRLELTKVADQGTEVRNGMNEWMRCKVKEGKTKGRKGDKKGRKKHSN